jgi:hypothetical protein
MNQMMGNLFYRGVSPSEIEAMPFWKMKYWNQWHEIMQKADEDEIKKAKAKNGQ